MYSRNQIYRLDQMIFLKMFGWKYALPFVCILNLFILESDERESMIFRWIVPNLMSALTRFLESRLLHGHFSLSSVNANYVRSKIDFPLTVVRANAWKRDLQPSDKNNVRVSIDFQLRLYGQTLFTILVVLAITVCKKSISSERNNFTQDFPC